MNEPVKNMRIILRVNGEAVEAEVPVRRNLVDFLRDDLGLQPQRVHHQFRLQTDSPATLAPALVEKLGDQAQSISIGRPSLEDVFIEKTGHEFTESAS